MIDRELIRVCLFGASGRMGQEIHREIHSMWGHSRFEVVQAISRSTEFELVKKSPCDVVIDFSHAAAVPRALELALLWSVPFVSGTTALSAETQALLKQGSKTIPVLHAANTSYGIAVLEHVVRTVARLLGTTAEIEIMETHHRLKKDAPSGTALRLANIAAAVLEEHDEKTRRVVAGPHGVELTRIPEEIVVHSQRGGDVIGEHTVTFFCEGERLEFTHRAHSRAVFARGALTAAERLVREPRERYLGDVLKITDLFAAEFA